MMLHKDFSLEIKDVSESGVIEGYASVFGGTPDSYGDVVLAGAFTDTLAKHTREGTMPLMLWGHQASELPIGDWLDMKEDRKGLWAKGQLDLEDSVGARVHRALKRKSVRGLSIGYETRERETDPKKPGISFLKALDLWEVSPVNFPAQRRAQITSVKSHEASELRDRLAAGDRLTEREWETLFKDMGLSNNEAERVVRVHGLKQGQGEPDATQVTGEDFTAALWEAMRSAPIIDNSGD
jgi:HK97 family phage prohead protease